MALDMQITPFVEWNHGVAAALVEGVLRDGGVAAVPTDTVYGLVCDARNEDAVRRMFAMKKRIQEKAFPIFVKDIAAARYYVYISDAKARFLEKVWPGAVTVVFRHKQKLPAILTGGRDTLGIRVPDHPLLRELLARLDPPAGGPLAHTSANISAQPPAKNAEEVKRYFEGAGGEPDLIIDGGALQGAASTVIDFTGAEPIILRAGPVSKQDLDALLSRGG